MTGGYVVKTVFLESGFCKEVLVCEMFFSIFHVSETRIAIGYVFFSLNVLLHSPKRNIFNYLTNVNLLTKL